jgi:hypothetical protein
MVRKEAGFGSKERLRLLCYSFDACGSHNS